MVTITQRVDLIVNGHTARFHAKHEARATAEGAASMGYPAGVWLDSLGFVVSRLDIPVTRKDATLVLEARDSDRWSL